MEILKIEFSFSFLLFLSTGGAGKLTGLNVLKLFRPKFMNFRNKLERLSLGKPFQPFLMFVCKAINTRRGWKGLPRTNTLACYGNRKLRP
jgi:hypothetical protein